MDPTECLDRPFSSFPDVSRRLHDDSAECHSYLIPQMGANGSRVGAPCRARVHRRQPRRPPVAERDPSSHAPRAGLKPAGRARASRIPIVPAGSDRLEGRPSSGQVGRGRGSGVSAGCRADDRTGGKPRLQLPLRSGQPAVRFFLGCHGPAFPSHTWRAWSAPRQQPLGHPQADRQGGAHDSTPVASTHATDGPPTRSTLGRIWPT